MYHILYDALLISEMPCIKGIYFLFPLGVRFLLLSERRHNNGGVLFYTK
jgi:hypothetical protein